MKKSSILSCALAALVLSAPASAQNSFPERFCTEVAQFECADWQALGFSSFASCFNARFAQCIDDLGPGFVTFQARQQALLGTLKTEPIQALS